MRYLKRKYIITIVNIIFLSLYYLSCSTTSILSDIEKNDLKLNNNPDIFSTFEWKQHCIQRGESLSMISEKYGISVRTIIAVNKLDNARKINVNDIFIIPSIDGISYIIKNGDTLESISSRYEVPLEITLYVNKINIENIEIGDMIFLPCAKEDIIDVRSKTTIIC